MDESSESCLQTCERSKFVVSTMLQQRWRKLLTDGPHSVFNKYTSDFVAKR